MLRTTSPSATENGRGVTKDPTQAAKWFRKAAEQGHARAQQSLGFAYLDGEGVPQDDFEAYVWIRLAVERGCPDAGGALIIAGSWFSRDDRQRAEQRVQELASKIPKQTPRVASVRVCDGVSAPVVVFAADYGSEDNDQIGPRICRSHCAGATSPGSLARAA